MVVVQSLFTERLTQTLHQLVLNRQTGLMSIEHVDDSNNFRDTGDIQKHHNERGEIYFARGEVVLAHAGSEVGVAALARIHSWQQASYTFHDDATIPLQALRVDRQPAAGAHDKAGANEQQSSQHTGRINTALLSQPRLAKSTRPLPQVPATPHPQSVYSTRAPNTMPETTLPGKYAIFRAYRSAATPTTMNRLERRERIVFALLDGRHAIQNVALLTHQSDVSVARIVVQLYYQGYIEYLQG